RNLAEKGLRTLALARRSLPADGSGCEDEIERELTLLGIVGILDPPRTEVPEAIALAQSAGIRVVMVTGDAAPTALAIAERVGLPADRSVSGAEIEELDDVALLEALEGGA
ncbi:MAG: HAD family hydrolase, partial [Acidobacteria bacterium]|nr:HAD family hydrolase [Acidobacteriota bacterium]